MMTPSKAAPLVQRYFSKKSGGGSFRPGRRPGKDYQSRHQSKPLKRSKKAKGPREPNDVTRPIPKIDLSSIKITNAGDEPLNDLSELGPLFSAAIQRARHEGTAGNELDVETQLKMMDFLSSAPGSTEELVGERRALSLESWDGQDRQAIDEEIKRLVEQERLDYLDLEGTDIPSQEEMDKEAAGGASGIPPNQLAHGDW